MNMINIIYYICYFFGQCFVHVGVKKLFPFPVSEEQKWSGAARQWQKAPHFIQFIKLLFWFLFYSSKLCYSRIYIF